MATIEGFLDELIAVVGSVSGIAYAPDDPPAAIATGPAAIVWLTDGTSYIGPPELATYHHTARVGLLTALQNIAIANQRILPRIEPVIEAIWRKLKSSSNGFDNCQNIERITYSYGPVEWGGVWQFGAIIDLEQVKIQRVI